MTSITEKNFACLVNPGRHDGRGSVMAVPAACAPLCSPAGFSPRDLAAR
jgi:hypothetical protein